jgi:hypothetical protein
MEETDYFYEKIGKALAEQNPYLDTATGEFVDAVRKEMVAQGIPPNRARGIIMMDEDFISDVATSYGHYCTVDAHHPLPAEIDLGNVKELDEIAALAGLTPPPAATPSAKPLAKPTGVAPAKPGVPPTPIMGEEEMIEGNEFTKARLDAIAAGSDTFSVGGKTYRVTESVNEDININVSANGEFDTVNLIRQLAGLQTYAHTLQQEYDTAADTAPAEEVAEERDIEYVNTPNEKIAPISAAIPNGTDLHKSKLQDPETANKAANPLAEKELEESLWSSYESMLNDVKK